MMNYEFLGQAVALLGSLFLFLLCILGILKMAWFALIEIMGWPSVCKALKLLRDHDLAEKQKAQGATK